MVAATLTSKGQITIPAEVRRALGLHAGSRVAFVPARSGGYELRPVKGSVSELAGCVPAPKRPVTLDDMDEAVAAGAASGSQ